MEYIRPYLITWTNPPTAGQLKEAIDSLPEGFVYGGANKNAMLFRMPITDEVIDSMLDGRKLVCGYMRVPIKEIT